MATKPKSDLERKQYKYLDKWPQLYALNLNGKSWTEIAESIGVTPRALMDAKRRHENNLGKLVTDPVEHRRRLIGAGWHALAKAVSNGDSRGASMLMRELSRLGGANAEVSADTGAATVVTGPVQINLVAVDPQRPAESAMRLPSPKGEQGVAPLSGIATSTVELPVTVDSDGVIISD